MSYESVNTISNGNCINNNGCLSIARIYCCTILGKERCVFLGKKFSVELKCAYSPFYTKPTFLKKLYSNLAFVPTYHQSCRPTTHWHTRLWTLGPSTVDLCQSRVPLSTEPQLDLDQRLKRRIVERHPQCNQLRQLGLELVIQLVVNLFGHRQFLLGAWQLGRIFGRFIDQPSNFGFALLIVNLLVCSLLIASSISLK